MRPGLLLYALMLNFYLSAPFAIPQMAPLPQSLRSRALTGWEKPVILLFG